MSRVGGKVEGVETVILSAECTYYDWMDETKASLFGFQCIKVCLLWISCAKVIRVRSFIDRLSGVVRGA